METIELMRNASPVRSKLLSRINERLVIRAIQSHGPLTRAEVTKHIGVTFPTVAKAAASLLNSRFLEEVDEAEGGPGRPAKRLRLATQTAQVLGVAIGHSECTIVAAGLDGVIREESKRSFPLPETYDALLIAITSQSQELMEAEGVKTLGIGISVPALVDYRQQRVIIAANFPLINGRGIGSDLAALLGVECVMVRDSHALCLSEQLHGVARGLTNFAMLDLCTGVGMGVMIDGRILTGSTGLAGEIGHIPVELNGKQCHCGKHGCLETVASEWALEERISRLMGRHHSMSDILELIKTDNEHIRFELKQFCRSLAIGMAYVLDLFNPDTIFVYGRIFNACPDLLEELVEQTKHLALEPAFSSCRFLLASGSQIEGTIASVINYLTESRVPDIADYVGVSHFAEL